MDSSGRIMFVDDNEEILTLLEEGFSDYNYDVVCASSGQDAIEKFRPGQFDIIISDLVMPEIDGVELLQQIREHDSEVVFVMMTGHPSIDTAVEAMKKGAFDYVLKPIVLEELNIRIQQILNQKNLKLQLKSVKWVVWALIISIPIWLYLGWMLTQTLRNGN